MDFEFWIDFYPSVQWQKVTFFSVYQLLIYSEVIIRHWLIGFFFVLVAGDPVHAYIRQVFTIFYATFSRSYVEQGQGNCEEYAGNIHAYPESCPCPVKYGVTAK